MSLGHLLPLSVGGICGLLSASKSMGKVIGCRFHGYVVIQDYNFHLASRLGLYLPPRSVFHTFPHDSTIFHTSRAPDSELSWTVSHPTSSRLGKTYFVYLQNIHNLIISCTSSTDSILNRAATIFHLNYSSNILNTIPLLILFLMVYPKCSSQSTLSKTKKILTFLHINPSSVPSSHSEKTKPLPCLQGLPKSRFVISSTTQLLTVFQKQWWPWCYANVSETSLLWLLPVPYAWGCHFSTYLHDILSCLL